MNEKTHLIIENELIAEGLITPDQLAVAKVTQKNLGKNLYEILVSRGFVTQEKILEKIASSSGFPIIALDSFTPDINLINIIPIDKIKNFKIFPYSKKENIITFVTSDPFCDKTRKYLREELVEDFDFAIAPLKDIQVIIDNHFANIAEENLNPKLSKPDIKQAQNNSSSRLKTHADDAVTAVQNIINEAVNENASDIHIEPQRDGALVRIRIDGSLEPVSKLSKTVHPKILSRLKIMSHLDVAESRLPQDGSCTLKVGTKTADLRIATYPTTLGEACALRITVRQDMITLEEMGLSPRDRDIFEQLIIRPHGILLVTGPTGSGKTTTLYASLLKIDRGKKRVLTVEDPAEREIEGVVQTQINTKAGITFPKILRSMLREDPDVIMVGEIRDRETAEISLRAAMTGHLVLSTLHTNSAIDAIPRLMDLGLDAYLIASTLRGVTGQRLVRKICQDCREEKEIPAHRRERLDKKHQNIKGYIGTGCNACNQRGFRGRIGIFEVIPIDEEFRILIHNKAPEVRLKEKAAELGSRTMFEDGLEKVSLGLTTFDEVLGACEKF